MTTVPAACNPTVHFREKGKTHTGFRVPGTTDISHNPLPWETAPAYHHCIPSLYRSKIHYPDCTQLESTPDLSVFTRKGLVGGPSDRQPDALSQPPNVVLVLDERGGSMNHGAICIVRGSPWALIEDQPSYSHLF